MPQSPGVFVIDQDPDARYQVEHLIPQVGFAVVGSSALGTEAIAKVTDVKPAIVLCGLKEPLGRVVQTIESIAHALPETPIIVYSTSDELELVRKAMLAGARDFLHAPVEGEELKRTLAGALEASERRRLRDSGSSFLGPEGAIVAVYGAKGGIGKTTVATNLAVACVRAAGQTAVLVDADDAFGDVAAMLAVTPEQSIADGLRLSTGNGAADAFGGFLCKHESGLSVAAAPANPLEWKELPSDRMQQLLHRLARQFDIVVVDTGGTLSDVTLGVLESASIVLWLTTPEYSSVRDTMQAIHALRSTGLAEDRIRLVLNMTSPELDVRPSSIEDAIGQKIFWTIPYDKLLRRSAQLGQPLVESNPESAAAANLTELALILSGRTLELVVSQNGNSGLRHRLFGGGRGAKESARS